MSDSNARESLEAKHERDREQRIEAIKRWAQYVASEPPETWGPQQNAVVDGQLEAARSVELSADHKRRVTAIARDIVESQSDSSDDSA